MGNLNQLPNSHLKFALNTGDVYAFDQAIAAGDNPLLCSESGDTMMHYAINSSAHVPLMLERLAMHGVDVNEANNMGATPLHAAVIRGDTAVVHCLVALGADVNARLDNGFSVFHLLAPSTPPEIHRLLYRYGADPDVTAVTGETAERVLQVNGHADVYDAFAQWQQRQQEVHPALQDNTPLNWIFAEQGVFAQEDTTMASWKRLPKMLQRAQDEAVSISPAALRAMVLNASRHGVLPQVVEALNSHGVRVGCAALLDDKQQPDAALKTIAENWDLRALFTHENFCNTSEMSAVYQALSPLERQQIPNYHQLRAHCATNPQGIGR
jgi:hypothetical protein